MTAVVLRMGPVSARWPLRLVLVNTLLVLLVLCLLATRLSVGAYPISLTDIHDALTGNADPIIRMIVIENRLGNLLTVLGVGIAFGLAGELVQSLLRNPLASPDIIGFTAGAGFGAVLSVVIVGTGAFVLPGAVAGGAVAAAAVLVFSWQRGVRPEQLVLTGIAVSLTVSVLTDLLITRLDANSAADLVKWLIGSFGATTPSVRLTLWGGIFLLLPLALWHQFALARVSHGGELAQSQGIDPRRNRLVTLCLAVALVALAVASAGPLPFVAFVSGPIAHGLNRAPRPTLFTAALVGSAITLLADMASRSLPGGFSLPAGIFTALIGAPVLLWVLYLQSRKAFP